MSRFLHFTDENHLTKVKAVEYWIKEKMEAFDGNKKSLSSLSGNSEFVHFALTSQDINNTAIPLALKDCINDVFKPQFTNLVQTLEGVCDSSFDFDFCSTPTNG